MGGESPKPASTPTGAVFLSYASQDAEAAQRICDALQSAGIEVWFDQSELRGGDAWDAAIRARIKACALFMPVISVNTQARAEGYFRLEWKLAVDRSHLMAADKAFLVPVVVDAVPPAESRVPDKFGEVQWTSAPGGQLSPDFVQRLRHLVDPAGPLPAVLAPATLPITQRGKPSLAVLPFVNMSGDSEQEYFADGMVEDIITALSRFNQLFVIARNSSFIYKGRAVDVRQVAAELGVRYILEGSVRRSGSRLRVTGQLIDASNGTHLWADKFDGSVEAVFDLQDAITANVVGAIEPTIKKAEIERARLRPPENLDVYDLYLRALPLIQAFRPAENLAGLDLLNKALSLDPNYAPALGHAAWGYEQRITRGWPPASNDDVGAAAACARQVAATGTDDAVALVLAGFALAMVTHDWDAGLHMSRRALERNPGSGFVNLIAAFVENFCGDPEQGLVLGERARALNPLDPAFFIYLLAGSFSHLFCGRPAQALAFAQRSVALYADWDSTYWTLITSYVQLGRLEEARQALLKLRALAPGLTVSALRRSLPYRNPASVNMIVDAMSTAGLPE